MLESVALKTPSNIYIRIAISLASLGVYAAIFPLIYPAVGPTSAVLTFIPMVVVGWMMGVRGTLPIALITFPLQYYLFMLVKDPYTSNTFAHVVSSSVFILVGLIIGWIRGLVDRVNLQTIELRQERRFLQDEIERRTQAEERLTHEALHDPLTNLPNRRMFISRLNHALEWNRRHTEDLFGVIYLDFDRFKVINDNLGHPVGDMLLITLAQELKASVRSMDTVARMGGDEFAILIEAVNQNEEVIAIVERLQKNLAKPVDVDGKPIVMTASIGIVLNLLQYPRLEDVLRDADIAMYSAKNGGRNRYKVFDMAMREQVEDLMILEGSLQQALQKEQFRIHYQPILSLRTQQITGFEALLRWEHPRRGLLYPADFLRVAEESGLIVPIGQWVLFEACRQIKKWQGKFKTDPPLHISVNLSARQFGQADLAQQIKEVLNATALPAGTLQLELTEMILIEDMESTVLKIQQLRDLGVGIAIDDFGMGYSSLGYLSKLPVNDLKIDRSFTSTLGVNKAGFPIIRAIVAMAESLNMKVVAEGIETEEQLNNLMELDCDYGQGYYFNKAIDVDTAEKVLRKAFPGGG